jgi:hypothetical protein
MDNATQLKNWTLFLKASNEKCDTVVRVMYQGTAPAMDSWSVGCKDGHEYSVGLMPDKEGSSKILGCDEMKAIDALLMKRVGKPPNKDAGCWHKF